MKTYEQALYNVHKALVQDINHKMNYKDVEYIEGMLDAARIVLDMMENEISKKEDE